MNGCQSAVLPIILITGTSFFDIFVSVKTVKNVLKYKYGRTRQKQAFY